MSKFTKIDSQFLIDNISLFTNKKTVIITGAGISVSCGIPDFRSSNGIFKTIREKLKIKGQDLFNYRYSRDKETRSTYFKFIAHLKEIVDKSEPSITHDFLSSIKKYQKKVRIYSQNIDMLEEKTGCVYNDKNSSELVYLHGNLKHLICIYCGYKIEYTEKENKILKNGEDLQCKRCVEENIKKEKSGRRSSFEGYMHTNIIHYDQPHHDAFRIGKLFEKDMDVDFFIVMGTSLKVYGVKDLVKRGLRSCLNNNGKSIFVNLEEPGKEYKGLFDYFWNDDCDDFCKAFNKGIEMAELNDKIEKIKIKKEKKKDFTDEMPIDKLEKTRSKKENKKDLINKIEKISFEKDSIDEMSIDKLEKIVIKKEKKKDLYDNIEKIIRKKENKKDAFDKIEKISLKKESIDELKKIGTKKEMKKKFYHRQF
ncbi:NAD-dependent deacetylase hst3 [Gurleya vavrai]